MAGANFPLPILREEEEMVRKAAKQVNDMMTEYRKHYPTLPQDKVLTMVAYHFSREILQLKQRNDTAPFTEKIKEMTELLDSHFHE